MTAPKDSAPRNGPGGTRLEPSFGGPRPHWLADAFDPAHIGALQTPFIDQGTQAPVEIGGRPLTVPVREFFAYWLAARHEGLVPKADAIRPSAIKALLPYYFCLEWMPDGALRFRLAGTAISAGVEMDLAGLDAFDFFEERHRERNRNRLALLNDMPCAGLVRFELGNSKGDAWTFESIYLPLKPPADGGPRLVGLTMAADAAFHGDAVIDRGLPDGLADFTYVDIGAGIPAAIPE